MAKSQVQKEVRGQYLTPEFKTIDANSMTSIFCSSILGCTVANVVRTKADVNNFWE